MFRVFYVDYEVVVLASLQHMGASKQEHQRTIVSEHLQVSHAFDDLSTDSLQVKIGVLPVPNDTSGGGRAEDTLTTFSRDTIELAADLPDNNQDKSQPRCDTMTYVLVVVTIRRTPTRRQVPHPR